MKLFGLYLGVLVSMLVIDGLWITVLAKSFYDQYLGSFFGPNFKLGPAAIFYLIYVLALIVLVIQPALAGQWSLVKTLMLGGLLGLAAYGTYDLTNQATLANWPLIVTIVDMAWGTFVTGVASIIGFYLGKFLG